MSNNHYMRKPAKLQPLGSRLDTSSKINPQPQNQRTQQNFNRNFNQQQSNLNNHRINQTGFNETNPDFKLKRQRASFGYQLANFSKTQEYLDSQTYTRKIKNTNQYQPYQCCVDTNQLKKYGVGIYLYLQFVKRLGVTLLIMSCLTLIPILHSYMTGTAIKEQNQTYMTTLAKTSIGNISNGDRTSYLIYTVCDVLSMIVFFFFYLHWRSFHNQTTTEEGKTKQNINPSTYALSVVGFDQTTPMLEKQLINYFQKALRLNIYQVEVVYNYDGNFQKFIHYDELIQKLEKQTQILKQTRGDYQQLQKIKSQVQQQQLKISQISQTFKPIYAIIHFRTLRSKFNFINFCRRYSLIDNFSNNLSRIICCQRLPPQNQLFMGKSTLLLKSNNLSRPEQINWPNLDVTGCSRFMRGILSILFLIVAIVITSSCIALCTLYVSSASACGNYDSDVYTTIQLAKAGGSQILYCFCADNFASIYTDSTIKSECGSLSNSIIYANIMQIGASLVSSISNVVLIIVVSLIAKYVLKSDNIPKQYSFIFTAVLISNYINSSVLPLVMNANIFGFQSLQYLKFIDFIDFNKVSVFRDYDVDWYKVVGPYYINFMIIAIIGPIIGLFTTAISYCWTFYRVRKACQNSSKDPIVQKQANAMIISQSFPIATEQALICLFFSITIMYSSLLPILIPIGCLVMLTTFLCKKYIILRYSVRVPADQALSQKTIVIIPWVILIHFLMGIWSHTAQGVFKQDSYIIKYSNNGILGDNFSRVFMDIIMLGAAAIVLAWIVFDYTILSFINCIRQSCKSQIQIPVQLATKQNGKFEEKYNQKLQNFNILGSYKLISNPTYGHPILAFKQLKRRIKKQNQLRATQTRGIMGSTIIKQQFRNQTSQIKFRNSQMMRDQLNPENQSYMKEKYHQPIN